MTTPYIPPEFQGEINLPSGIDPAASAAAKRRYEAARAREDAYEKSRKEYEARAKRAKSKKTRSTYTRRAQSYQAQEDKWEKTEISRRNTYYEASGQWDKLLKGANRDAFMALNSMFGEMGLGSLAGKIYEYVQQGYGADTISLLLQDTKEYKQRFAGNEARKKAGLPALSPAEYLSTESAYRQILAQAGLPKGFYDNPADFSSWIGGDVSPTEIKGRVDEVMRATTQADPAYKQALKAMYGVDESYLAAYFLDRGKALPLLQKQARAAEIGAAALRRGFAASRTAFEDYATYGISGEQAEQGFGQIAETYNPMRAIAERFGLTWDQREAEQEVFTPGAGTPFDSAAAKGKRLRSQERALFSGRQGSSAGGLAAGYRQT